jgi:hypothetical protein
MAGHDRGRSTETTMERAGESPTRPRAMVGTNLHLI